jgi:predicted HD phosphohydrolase
MSDQDREAKPGERTRVVADWFEGPGASPRLMRELLQREATVQSARFGIERREFLTSSMGALAALAVMQQAPRFASRAEAQAEMRSPTEDCYAQLADESGAQGAARASFTRIDQGSPLDWQIIDAAARGQQFGVADTVLNMLRALKGLYAGFSIDQHMHVTQTATRAKTANASDELIVIALVHDMAKIISNYNHPEIVASIVRPYVSYGSYRILRHHMEFQWKNYGAAAGLPTNLRDRYTGEAWYPDAARFSDEWDQTSFDSSHETLPLDEFEPLVRAFFDKEPAHENLTASDCL